MKSWHKEIERHILTWSNRLGNLGWWPRYVYHFTDVQNAAQILTDGVLYCRSKAEELGRMIVDNASPEVISKTKLEHTDYVRLYFRPRTPTQFRNEGIRPRANRELGAHCPIPVYFCFDALEILASDQTEFSNGNMASPRTEHSAERDFFFNIPFQYVFHNGAFPPNMREEIVLRRNAEVLIAEKLGLQPALRFLACRSAAERQTLLHLLPSKIATTWNDKIRLGEQGFFERKWTHVEEAVVVDQGVTFRFNPNTQTPGPFEVTIEYKEKDSSPTKIQRKIDRLNDALRIRLPKATWGEIRLYLDDALAFSDSVFFEDLPF